VKSVSSFSRERVTDELLELGMRKFFDIDSKYFVWNIFDSNYERGYRYYFLGALVTKLQMCTC
jgi:hypothetical protein